MMKIEIKEIYKCDHCNKLYQIKSWAEQHEEGCNKNPDNFRACFGCKHLCKKNVDYWFDTYHGEDSKDVLVFYCEKIDSCLYPPKVELAKKWFDFGDINNQPMKKKCEFFKAPQMMPL